MVALEVVDQDVSIRTSVNVINVVREMVRMTA